LAHEFVKRGHEVTIFAREFPGQTKEETVDGIRYVRRGGYAQSTSIKRDLVQCLLYALATARHVPSGDVVVTNDFWMPAVLPWLKPSAGKVVPCLQRFPKKQGWLYAKCAALAAVSQAVADAVKAQTPSVADHVVVVPNAVDEVFLGKSVERGAGSVEQEAEGTWHAAGSGEWEAKSGNPPSRWTTPASVDLRRGEPAGQAAGGGRPVRILFVGRIHPEKGLGLLAQALRLLADRDQGPKDEETKGPQMCESPKVASPRSEGEETERLSGERAGWECVLVGPVAEAEGGGGEAFAAELKRQVEGLPVRFEAPVYEPEKLAKIYDEADVFVYPSVAETGESFGIAPLEAMARGVVPVVSDLAAFREYLVLGENGMVFDHRSSDAAENLAAALRELVGNEEQRMRLGAEARETAEHFSTQAIADKYLQLFARLV
jgi:glycosyltransferase involved in cell wall biosynthesis